MAAITAMASAKGSFGMMRMATTSGFAIGFWENWTLFSAPG
jgi:hypothetical protein